jgi:hypothetical protein
MHTTAPDYWTKACMSQLSKHCLTASWWRCEIIGERDEL